MNKQVILITGASSGIGKATALQLLEEGHIVYGAARRVEKMKELEEKGGIALKMDVTIDEDMVAGVERILQEQGRIDVLINNAGYAIYGSVEETSIADARRQFEVNLFGPARLTQLVIPHMRQQQSGKIINMSSMGGKVYTPLGAWYHATKHALEGWSDCLRLELKQFGIEVVIIEPGAILTEFGEVMNQPMLERSGNGPYASLARAMAKAVEDSYEKGNASPPSVIARVVSKAIRANKPKTRYVAGKLARPLMMVRKYLGDRVFDKAVMSQVK
ncbi:MAG: oxidoreductase [Bacteroidetes bacterium]|nr:MAG: oxidoreductase [Bacteroidota bacterium]